MHGTAVVGRLPCVEPIKLRLRGIQEGFGDGKYVSFEERQWHQPCFKCSCCSVSLVGSGFFPDRDKILCTDCHDDE